MKKMVQCIYTNSRIKIDVIMTVKCAFLPVVYQSTPLTPIISYFLNKLATAPQASRGFIFEGNLEGQKNSLKLYPDLLIKNSLKPPQTLHCKGEYVGSEVGKILRYRKK